MYQQVKETPIFFTSTDGVRSLNDSRSSVHLNPPLELNNTQNHYFSVLDATIVNVSPNVSAALLNNTITVTGAGVDRVYVFPDGLYSVDDIQETLNEFLRNDQTVPLVDEGLLVFRTDNATSTISLQINTAGVGVAFATGANSIGPILGFTADIPGVATAGTWVESNQTAALNRDTEILVKCNFCTGSYSNQKGGSNVVAAVTINQPPGSLLRYQPYVPYQNKISGYLIDEVVFTLVNQNDQALDLRGEPFTVNGVIRSYQ